ncbi:RluA family pseudouridine synthase [Alicyclobacillaceae bacterium I2511]|nr:RluA family pseudouridine synthase [Alicyclobacillaceae bacterium I2511]
MSKLPFRYTLTVTDNQSGRTIRSLLQHELQFSTRLQRNPVFREQVRCNDRPAFLHERIKPGDILSVPLPPEVTSVALEPTPIDICYEDDQVLVINKSAGILTHPSARERQGSLLAAVAAYLHPLGQVPHCVHRLDRETSGVVMFARHAHFHHLFDVCLRDGKMHRSYCALVRPPKPRRISLNLPMLSVETGQDTWQTIDLNIGQDPQRPSRRVIMAQGQRAITHFRVLARTDTAWLVGVHLETGRTHQIRLHFAAVGMPLLGDFVYGDRQETNLWKQETNLFTPVSKSGFDGAKMDPALQFLIPNEIHRGRQALHAVRLSWQDPVTGTSRQADAPVAQDLKQLWQSHGGAANVWQDVQNSLLD